MQSLQALIADPLSMYMDPSVQQSVFGTIDPAEIADLYRAWCLTHLGRDIAEAWLWSVSVGCVAAVVLRDGRRVVIKAHQPDRDQHRLSAIATIQALACDAGLPAPRPLTAPHRLGAGWAVAEEALDIGRRPNLLRSPDRATAAAGWVHVTEVLHRAAPILVPHSQRETRVVDGLFPTPHSPMFDFEATSAGADWIDELAKRAWHTMQQLGTPPTVVHADWRSDNIRVSDDGTDIVAIYDWDSVRLEPEATALGQVAAMHSVDWSHRDGPYFATAIECVEFAASVESARHEPYSMSDWRVVRASIVYGWCYTARCEHAVASAGHDKPEFGMRHRLLADGAALLAQG